MNGRTEPTSRDGWLKVLSAGDIVVAVTGRFPLIEATLGEDASRCKVAVRFLFGFGRETLYADEGLSDLKAVFVEMAEAI